MTEHRAAWLARVTALALVAFIAWAPACAGKATPSRLASDAGDSRPDGAGRSASATPSSATGDLRVIVRWPDAPAALRAAPGYNACGAARRPLVRVHTLGGVADVLVQISASEDGQDGQDGQGSAPATRAGPASATRAEITREHAAPPALTVRDCRPAPPVVVVPPGEHVAVRTDDEVRHEVTVQRLRAPGQRSDDREASENAAQAARFALPIAGSELRLALPSPGLYAVRTTAAPEEPSYLAIGVAIRAPRGATDGPDGRMWAHTDERGDVRFSDISVGRYDIVAWHPPVAPNGPAIEARAAVTVEQGATASVTVELQLPGAAGASDRDRR